MSHFGIVRIAGLDNPTTHHTRTDITTVQPLTPGAGQNSLLLQTVGGNVRYTLDGTAPTGTTGYQLLDGLTLFLTLTGVTFKVIRESGSSAAIEYEFGD